MESHELTSAVYKIENTLQEILSVLQTSLKVLQKTPPEKDTRVYGFSQASIEAKIDAVDADYLPHKYTIVNNTSAKIDNIEEKILSSTERALIIEEAVEQAVKTKKQSNKEPK